MWDSVYIYEVNGVAGTDHCYEKGSVQFGFSQDWYGSGFGELWEWATSLTNPQNNKKLWNEKPRICSTGLETGCKPVLLQSVEFISVSNVFFALLNLNLIQPWWLRGRVSASHSVWSRHILSWWIYPRLSMFYVYVVPIPTDVCYKCD